TSRNLPWNRRVAYRTRLSRVNRTVAVRLRAGSVLHVLDEARNRLTPRAVPLLQEHAGRALAAGDDPLQGLEVDRLVPVERVAGRLAPQPLVRQRHQLARRVQHRAIGTARRQALASDRLVQRVDVGEAPAP